MSTPGIFSRQASLIGFGRIFRQMGLWDVIKSQVHIRQKIRRHDPLDKLLDVYLTILAGGQGIVESNTRVRPDAALQKAFGRAGCAEQSTLSRTLNACTPETVEQLRSALQVIVRQHGQCYRHDYATAWQILDVDMTGLLAGEHCEGASKGYFAHQPGKRGRQLGRVLASRYGELVCERLYPGQRQLEHSLVELVEAAEQTLELEKSQVFRTILRTDGGAGTDANIQWCLQRGYQLMTKMHSWARAKRLASPLTEWQVDTKVPEREFAWVTQPIAYARPTRQIAIRRRKLNKHQECVWHYQVLVTTLTDPMLFELLGQPLPDPLEPARVLQAIAHVYDLRDGALETAHRNDKQGLGLSHRNKRSFAAQEIVTLLAQLAHNFTVWMRQRLSHHDPRLLKLGHRRMVRDVFQIDGLVTFGDHDRLTTVHLNLAHPYAQACNRVLQE